MLSNNFSSKVLNLASTLVLSVAILSFPGANMSWAMEPEDDKDNPKDRVIIQWSNSPNIKVCEHEIPLEIVPLIVFAKGVQRKHLDMWSLVSKDWYSICHPLVIVPSAKSF